MLYCKCLAYAVHFCVGTQNGSGRRFTDTCRERRSCSGLTSTDTGNVHRGVPRSPVLDEDDEYSESVLLLACIIRTCVGKVISR